MRNVLGTLVVLAVLIGTQIVAENAEAGLYRLLFGGTHSDIARGIFVDSNYIYIVGHTSSFGPNPTDPTNLFLSIFKMDNTHKCSVAVDLGRGISERGWRVVAHEGTVYVVGDTNYGANPYNILLVKFDTNCNVLGVAVYNIDGDDQPWDLSISPDGSTLYIAGESSSGAHLLAVRISNFSVAWAKLFRMIGAGDRVYSVAFSGNKLYVTGGGPSTGDLFVSRFDAATGNHELTKVFSTPQIEVGWDIVVDGGKVYVAGIYRDPSKDGEFLFMRLDPDLKLELAKTFGTTAFDGVLSLSMVGGLAYGVGWTEYFISRSTVLFAVNPSTGDLIHAFELSSLFAEDSTSTGTCLIYTATLYSFSGDWPTYYRILDSVTAGTVSFRISSPSPSITSLSVTPVFPTPTAERFTPTFNKPAPSDAFYSWFCPEVLVVSTTTTSTILTTSTLTLSTTTTKTEATTLTHSTTYSTTTTLSTTTTITQSTTTTLITTTTSTQYFAEPITTYVVPVLLVVIAALLGASLVMGRRRKLSSG
jgi:hypothetical protein